MGALSKTQHEVLSAMADGGVLKRYNRIGGDRRASLWNGHDRVKVSISTMDALFACGLIVETSANYTVSTYGITDEGRVAIMTTPKPQAEAETLTIYRVDEAGKLHSAACRKTQKSVIITGSTAAFGHRKTHEQKAVHYTAESAIAAYETRVDMEISATRDRLKNLLKKKAKGVKR